MLFTLIVRERGTRRRLYFKKLDRLPDWVRDGYPEMINGQWYRLLLVAECVDPDNGQQRLRGFIVLVERVRWGENLDFTIQRLPFCQVALGGIR